LREFERSRSRVSRSSRSRPSDDCLWASRLYHCRATVGLPDKAVAESRERVRAALGSLGLGLPPKRITVNLAPADVLKEGSHFDLPIALGLLAAMEVLATDELGSYMALGELALEGR
jgi:magnesium chelatase family protein